VPGSASACDDPDVPQTVLIVDDHVGFRGFARRLLEAGGYTVVGEAGDGASALAAVAALRPELVLLDVMLPDIDGFAVAERIAGNGDDPVVVLTSSREAADFGQRLERTSARGFIHKDELSRAALVRLVGAPG
jgi:two-component system nitrate/nitrite response regulator NarL